MWPFKTPVTPVNTGTASPGKSQFPAAEDHDHGIVGGGGGGSGIPGLDGESGDEGEMGLPGQPGPTGSAGAAGATGAAGAQGQTGLSGLGLDGYDGEDGEDSFIPGPPGPASAGAGINQLTGDVTAGPGSGSQAATIANDAVTYAKIQNVSAASKLLGRGSAGGAGDPEEITLGTNLSMSGTTLNASGGTGTESMARKFLLMGA